MKKHRPLTFCFWAAGILSKWYCRALSSSLYRVIKQKEKRKKAEIDRKKSVIGVRDLSHHGLCLVLLPVGNGDLEFLLQVDLQPLGIARTGNLFNMGHFSLWDLFPQDQTAVKPFLPFAACTSIHLESTCGSLVQPGQLPCVE